MDFLELKKIGVDRTIRKFASKKDAENFVKEKEIA